MDIEIKRGQVTIWVIVAVVLLVILLILFLFQDEIDPKVIPGVDPINEISYMERCVADSVNEAVSIMLPRGGFIEPINFRNYNGTPVALLCENKGFYEPCIQQHPVLIKEMELEIENYIFPKIEDCLNDIVREGEDDGVEVILDRRASEISVDLTQDNVRVEIERKITFNEKEGSRSIDGFDYTIYNSAYNLAFIALEIAAQEAEYCYFEYVGYSVLYPRYSIKPFGISDSVIIYSIEDTKSEQVMNIAIRSCAIPAGI